MSKFINLLCSLLLLSSCKPLYRGNAVQMAPVVTEVNPKEWSVSPLSTFKVHFSKPMAPDTLGEENILLVESIDASKEGGIAGSHKKKGIPCTLTWLPEMQALSIRPKHLEQNTDYTLFLSSQIRDLEGNPLVGEQQLKSDFRYDFKTLTGPPKVVRYNWVTENNLPLSSERRYFDLVFDQPVHNWSKKTVFIGEATEAFSLVQQLIYYPKERLLRIKIQGLQPDKAYEVKLTSGIQNDRGENLEEMVIPFQTAKSEVLSEGPFSNAPVVEAYDTHALFRFSYPHNKRWLWWGGKEGAWDCLQKSCPQSILPLQSGNIKISDLTVNRTYWYWVVEETPEGKRYSYRNSFTTSALPKLTINELLLSPALEVSKRGGEYIELVNWSEASLPISGYFLELRQDEDKVKTCPLKGKSENLILQPGQYALLVSNQFDSSYYEGLAFNPEVLIVRGALCAVLSNSKPQKIMLRDEKKRVVSSWSAWETPKERGRSIERVRPDAEDLPGNFCFSDKAMGPTPGKANSTTKGCKKNGRS